MPDADLHLSAITIGELWTGVERTRDRDPKKAADLEAWIAQVVNGYSVLPWTARHSANGRG